MAEQTVASMAVMKAVEMVAVKGFLMAV